MASTADIKRASDRLRTRYSTRDTYYLNNYYAYHGEYNRIGSGYADDPLTDVRIEDDHVQVWNLVPSVVDVHRMLLNRLPMIDVPSEEMGEEKADKQAEKREKMHYVMWDNSKMIRKHGEQCWNLSVYNVGVWFVRWDKESDLPIITVREPGTCYPMFKRGGDELAYCIFRWEEDAESVWENYPQARSLLAKDEARAKGMMEVIEYVDSESYGIVIGDKWKSLSEDAPKDTKLGFCPVSIVPASFVPGNPFPPGPVHQLVAINDHLNRFQTKWGKALELVMWPTNILKGDNSDNVVWDPTPGALNRFPDGVEYEQVAPPNLPTEIFVHIERMEQLMRRIAGVSETAYGESPGSIVTGKAVSRLQGVMTGMASEAQANLALSLQEVNKMCFRMLETYKPKKKYVVRSNAPGTNLSSPGRSNKPFVVEFVPEQDIGGWYDNIIRYSPFGSDFSTGLSTAMQMVQSGLASEQWVIDQTPGMGDSEGMMKEIEENKRRKMKLELELQTEAQLQIMQAQMQMQQMQQQTAGAPPGAEGGAPPEEGGAPAGGGEPTEGAPGLGNTLIMPSGQPQAMGTGEPFVGEEQFPLPFTDVQPYAKGLEAIETAQGGGTYAEPTEGEALPGQQVIKLQEVLGALKAAVNRKGEKAIEKLKGAVYLIGEIAERGWTDEPVVFGITKKADQQIITTALPQYASQNMLRFKVIAGAIPPEAVPVKGGGEVGEQTAA